MSGVIDESGQQWEHCNHCGDFAKYEELAYAWSPRWPESEAVDLCPKCEKHLAPHRELLKNLWATLNEGASAEVDMEALFGPRCKGALHLHAHMKRIARYYLNFVPNADITIVVKED